MRRSLAAASIIAIAACAAPSGEAAAPAAAAGAPPVATAPPNAPEQKPAFPGQTRAPERLSGVKLKAQTVATGLANPFAVEILPGGDLLVTEKKSGEMRVIGADGTKGPAIEGVPAVDLDGQGGLLDLALSPAFASDRLVYFTFAEPRGDGASGTSLARGRLSQDGARLEGVAVIFRQQPSWKSGGHYGSRIAFAPDGAVFVGLGERQRTDVRRLAQDPKTHIGAVVRLNPDGSARPGNPFAGNGDGAVETWSYGHRNIQGAAVDPKTGDLWTLEHGAQGGDELNRPQAGRNYGWPIITYGEDYGGGKIGEGLTQKDGMEQPVYYWDPVIAPGAIAFYDGPLFPEWSDDLLIATLQAGLVRLDLKDGRVIAEERFDLGLGRLRDIAVADDGALWLVTDDSDGALVRVTRE